METTPTIYRSLEAIARPAALVFAVLAFLIAAGFGAGALSMERASAQPVLTMTGGCTPDSVRPGEPALIACTVSITNEGTETATNLVGNLGPSSSCSLPNPLPTFIDRTHNGELVSTDPLPLSFDLGDLAPGATFETVSRLVVSDSGTGVVGGQVSVFSQDDPAVTVSGETCWTVSADAAAPPTNLRVTKTLLSELIFPDDPVTAPPPVPLPAPGPAPTPNVDVVVLEPVVEFGLGSGLEKAEFEIVVTNVSGTDMTGVTILDVQTGSAVLLSAEPPPSGTDAAGRPTWDAGTLAPGGEFRIVASFGPPPDGNCAYADDVVVVSATPAGGETEDYVALADFGVNVGPCVFIQPTFCEHFPPGEGFSVFAPCDETVWWAAPPDGGDYQPVFSPIPDAEYCWFLPPTGSTVRGEGPVLQLCSEPVCWISFGPAGGDVVGQIPCDFQFCEYTAPDGSQTFQEGCDFPVCWSMPPGGADWQPIFGCGEFEELCWFSPPGAGEPAQAPCEEQICWISFGPAFGPDDGDVVGQIPCDFQFCEYSAPDGSQTVQGGCDFPVCWSMPPEGGDWQILYGCGQFEEQCWFSLPGDEGPSQLGTCGFPLRFAVNPPPGAVDFGIGPQPISSDEPWCWPVPPDGGQFFTFPIPCSNVELITWFTPPDGGPLFPNLFGDELACWAPLPPDIELPPGAELPPDLLIPGPCPPGEEGKTGVPGSSVPAEVVEAVSTPAETAEGTVTKIEPQPSADVTPMEIVDGTSAKIEPMPSSAVLPAELVPSDRVELVPGVGFEGEDGSGGDFLLGPLASPEAADNPAALGAPTTGAGPAGDGDSALPWALALGLAAIVLLLAGGAWQLRRRYR